jgi:hypothetical protein
MSLLRHAPLLIATALPLFLGDASHAEQFTPTCANPSSPGKRMAVDQRCGIEGSGGKEAEQNAVKNNFCANDPVTVLSFARFKELQSAVEQDPSINFGDRANKGSHGPTVDRAPLTALGEGTLVQVRAYVLAAKQEGKESVNCGAKFDKVANKNAFHDIHISLVETSELANPSSPAEERANECQGSVVEMIPHYRPPEWTAAAMNRVRDSHLPVRVTGQLFFDSSHVPCAADKPVRTNPKRFSLWEIHPIYQVEVCTADCNAEGTWLALEEWVRQHPTKRKSRR